MSKTSRKKAAVVSAAGIGDALIMMIASYNLQKAGYEVTTFSNHLASFGAWFKDFTFAKQPKVEEFAATFSKFDSLFLQHENSHRARAIFSLRKSHPDLEVYCFYNNYRSSKHEALDPKFDFALDESRPMAENLAEAMQSILGLKAPEKGIGMTAPEGLMHRRFENRVCIHPTSSSSLKNWSPNKYLKLARKLQYRRYQPSFLVSPDERKDWLWVLNHGFDLPLIPTLADLANYVYESGYFIGNDSGPGHLASYLDVPLLILAPLKQSISHWQPGWRKADIILPSTWAPNMKGLRLRENNWQMFVSVARVFSQFKNLTNS